jgi:hypothetical protein
MLHRTYFLIEPRPGTREALTPHVEKELLSLLCAPQSISHEWADRSSWQPTDSELIVKLTCLADMLGSFPDATRRAEIFGSAEITEVVFDRWWSIRRIEHLGSTSDYGDAIAYFSDHLPRPARPLVAEWIHRQSKLTDV